MIAERADISVRTFFRYFESKLDVIYLDYRRSTSDLLILVEKRLAYEPAEIAVLNASIQGILAFTDTPPNRERLIRAFQSQNFTERRAFGQLYTRRCLVDFLVPRLADDPEPELTATLIVMLVRGVVSDALEFWAARPELDVVELINRMFDQIPKLASTVAAAPPAEFEAPSLRADDDDGPSTGLGGRKPG